MVLYSNNTHRRKNEKQNLPHPFPNNPTQITSFVRQLPAPKPINMTLERFL